MVVGGGFCRCVKCNALIGARGSGGWQAERQGGMGEEGAYLSAKQEEEEGGKKEVERKRMKD